MGLINIYSHLDSGHKVEKANGRLSSLYPEIDFNNAIVLSGGNRITADYEVKDNDVIFIRQLPGDPVVIGAVSTAIAVVSGIIAGLSLYSANAALQEAQNAIKNSKNSISDVDALPFLKGANNQSAQGRTFPLVIGNHYFTPYRLAPKYYEVSGVNGVNEYVNMILEAGFNPLIIKKINLGSICIWNNEDAAEKTDGLFNFDSGTYYDEENLIEIRQSDEFTTDAFTKKIVSDYYQTEIANAYGTESADIVPVVKQLQENTMSMDICILFDGLRKYDSDAGNYVKQSATIHAYWSNKENPDTDTESDWNLLSGNETFCQYASETKVSKTTVYTYTFTAPTTRNDSTIKTILCNNIASWVYSSGSSTRPSSASAEDITLDSVSYTVESEAVDRPNGGTIRRARYTYTIKFTYAWTDVEYIKSYSDTFEYNSKSQMRFIAHKDFTAEEAYGKQITIKLVRATPTSSGTSQESCYLYFVNSQIYDSNKSTSSALVACKPLEEDARAKCCRIGIRMKATEDNASLSDSVSIVAAGMARVWAEGTDEDGNTIKDWTTTKQETRNPAAWLLEILTSPHHAHSEYSDSELDLDSFGAWFEYCENNNFYADAVLTDSKTKQDLCDNLLKLGNATLIINAEGLKEVCIDQEETNPVALLNTQNIIDVTVTKDFSRKTDGRKITFVNRDSWEEESVYYMKDGTSTHTAEDSISEIAPEYITTYDHAIKYARRDLAMSTLQPMEVTAEVSKEGAYYPLYSCVDVQLPHLKKGLNSSIIRKVTVSDNYLQSITLADKVTFTDGYNYGVIIQAVTDSGRKVYTIKVSGSGTTDTLTVTDSIDTSALSVAITAGSIVSFGILDSDGEFTYIRNRMKIYGISPSDKGYKLTLKEYNASIYAEGSIPEYVSTVTPEPQKQKTEIQSTAEIADTAGIIKQETDAQIKEVKELIEVSNKYSIDLAPEYQILSVDSEGNPYSESTLSFEAFLYYETSALTGVTWSAKVNGSSVIGSWNENVFSVSSSDITADITEIEITAAYTNNEGAEITRTAVATVSKLYAESSWEMFDMELSDNAVSVDTDGNPTPEEITVKKIKRGDGYTIETNEGHVKAIIDEDKEYTVNEYEKDSGSGYDSQIDYKTKQTPFYLLVDGDALEEDSSNVMVFYFRDKE